MQRLTETVHRILGERLKPGDLAIDATAGNGHDTLFLAQTVGFLGWVYAFDVQEAAIEATRQRLQSANVENVTLFTADHATLADQIPKHQLGQISAVVFNLGYLPGSDKKFTTQKVSTCNAIAVGLKLLRTEGTMTILAYIGHPGGLAEALAVEGLLQALSEKEFIVEATKPNHPQSPWLFVVTRRENKTE